MMTTRRIRLSQSRRGIIAVLVAVSLVAIVAIAALSLDGGRMMDEHQKVQTAANAAAGAGAQDLFAGEFQDVRDQFIAAARRSAFSIAGENGYDNDGQNSIVTVNIPPVSGAYAGNAGYIEVIVEARQRRAFSNIFGSEAIPIRSRAVAAGTLVPSKASVLVLDPKGKGALKVDGAKTSLKVQGDMIVNSKNKNPASVKKDARLQAENFLFSGKFDRKQFKDFQRAATGEIHMNIPPTPDPLAGLAAPTGLPSRNADDFKSKSATGGDLYELQPGVYSKELKFDRNDTVILAPGTYVFTKKLEIKDGTSFTGHEVTLYMKGGQMKFEKSAVSITPSKSGPYAGISIFLDDAKKGKVVFARDAYLDLNGTIYAPTGEVRFQDTTAVIDDDVEDDSLDDAVDAFLSDEAAFDTSGGINAQIIAAKVKVQSHSHIEIGGAGIDSRKPLLGIVE